MRKLLFSLLLFSAPLFAAPTYLGYSSSDASAGNGSDTGVTIPSGATVAIIMVQHWDSTTSNDFLSATLDGQSATAFQTLAADANNNAEWLGYVTGFSTGASKTLSWTWDSNEAISDGGNVYITYWSGVDTTTPIGDSDEQHGTGTASVQDSVTTDAGDVVVVSAMRYVQGGLHLEVSADGSPTINSILDDDTVNNYEIDLDYFTRTQATHVIDITNEYYSGIIVAVLQSAAAGGTSDVVTIQNTEATVGPHQSQRLGGMLDQ